jgi:hypothetical protein
MISTESTVSSRIRLSILLVVAAIVLVFSLEAPGGPTEPVRAPEAVEARMAPAVASEAVVALLSPTAAPPSTTTTQTSIATTTSAPPAPTTTEAPPRSVSGNGDPDDDASWERLMQCESGGKGWAVNTGNGYYGGLQFDLPSWQGAGGSGYPHQASREEQIKRGRIWYAANGGWSSWPACTRSFGWR